ncbi:MAG: nascent polypeptide-associated complex protein [Nanoarchaeota archaeon]
MNKKALEQAMKKLNIKQEEIDASEVLIKTREGKDLIIRNPQVSKVNMMGQETLQIVGTLEELSAFSEEDVKTIMEQANIDEAAAKKALEKHKGDLAETLLELQK